QLDVPCAGGVGGDGRRAARPVVLPGYELSPPRRGRGKQPDEGGPEEDSGVSHPCGSFSSVRKTQIAWRRRLVPLRRRTPCGAVSPRLLGRENPQGAGVGGEKLGIGVFTVE